MSTAAARPSVERLRRSLDELPKLVESLPKERFKTQPGPNEWSAQEVLVHLADAEQVYGVRVRMILTRDQPTITSYDQETWAKRFTELETPAHALARWRVLRESMLELLGSLGDADWQRFGMHEERGRESVEKVAQLMADHDENHMAQMRDATGA
jgi:uncharacterized damage-inducible protein DinB